MAYLGAQPNKTLTKTTSQSFNGTGSATTFTLNRAVNTEEELEVFVENVQQEPGSGKSYTASGTTLTFDEAPPSGTGNIYVIYRGLAEVTTRLEHDANQALSATTGTFTQLNSDNIRIDGNTISSTDTNGDITLDPNGTGDTIVASGNLAVGTTSPSELVHIKGASGAATDVQIQGGDDTNSVRMFMGGSTNRLNGRIVYGVSDDSLQFSTSGNEQMRIDAGGSMLLGSTTPTDLHNTWRHLIMGDKGAVISQDGAGGIAGMTIADNAYIDSDTGAYAYQTTNETSKFTQEGGNFIFNSAASGTAGTGITFKERMRLNSDGLLYLDSQGNGSNHDRWQAVSGNVTAAASGSSKKVVRCGHSFAGTIHVIALEQYAVGSGSAIFTAAVSYGSPSVTRHNFAGGGNITNITMAYNNGGSPSYTFDVTVTYSGNTPTIFVNVQGISHTNMYIF